MSAWWSLTKKEIRLGVPIFLFPFISFILISGIAAYAGHRSGYLWEPIIVVCTVALSVHVVYLSYYLVYSLSIEKKKLHLWLHNPLPGYALILAKIASGLVWMVFSLLFVGGILVISTVSSNSLSNMIEWPFNSNTGAFLIIHLFLIAISLAVLFLFFYMIFLLFNRSFGNFLSSIFTFILFIAAVIFYDWLSSSLGVETLTSWGEFTISDQAFSFNLEMTGIANAGTTLYIGYYLYEATLALLVFGASCWLLDRKVEVSQ